jgi:aminoglycoside phosphotransferase family enzyme/predicted kinase
MGTNQLVIDRRLPPLVRAMMNPDFFADRPAQVELKETLISFVLLAGHHAYKVKKPAHLAFIDASTTERRKQLCQEEVRLNRRLSPQVYLGVIAIVSRDGGYVLIEDDVAHARDAVEYAVKMRRLPSDRMLDQMIADGTASLEDIRSIAERLVTFHARAAKDRAWNYGSAEAISRLVAGNLAEIEPTVADPLIRAKLARLGCYFKQFTLAHRELLDERARNGFVLEGHGDVRCDCICFTEGRVEIFDCLEFSESLRYCDVAAEIAFLAMDLDRLGQSNLSDELVRRYVELSNDPDILKLITFYKCYRATIRLKVEIIRSVEPDRSSKEQAEALERAHIYLDLAMKYAGEAPAKNLVIVCGASGSGKSTLARQLAGCLGFEVLSSDVERKRLAGIAPTTHFPERFRAGIYSEAFSRRVYEELLVNAEKLLKQGKGVIVDATFRHRGERALAIDVAMRLGVKAFFVECRAEPDEIRRRLIERQTRAREVSDATVETYLEQVNDFEPMVEILAGFHLVADTSRGTAEAAAFVEREIDRLSRQSIAGVSH